MVEDEKENNRVSFKKRVSPDLTFRGIPASLLSEFAEKIEFEFDWKMVTQDIWETAKISQLSWGTFEKEKKEGVAGDISTFVGVQSLENSAFRYRSSSSP